MITLDALLAQKKFEEWQESLLHRSGKFSTARPKDIPDKDWEEFIQSDDYKQLLEREKSDKARAEANQTELMETLEQKASVVCKKLLNNLELGNDNLRDLVPTLPKKLTVAEMQGKNMPVSTEQTIWSALSAPGKTPPLAHAADPRFWTLCHIHWISKGMFEKDIPSTFCGKGGQSTLEGKTRTFLRRMGGLYIVRGSVSVFEDCPIARAYWRGKLAKEASATAKEENVSLDTNIAHEILHQSKVWGKLILLSVRRITALNVPRARTAFLVACNQLFGGNTQSLTENAVSNALSNLGKLSHDYSLWYVPWKQLVEVAADGIESAKNSSSSDSGDDDDEADDESDEG